MRKLALASTTGGFFAFWGLALAESPSQWQFQSQKLSNTQTVVRQFKAELQTFIVGIEKFNKRGQFQSLSDISILQLTSDLRKIVLLPRNHFSVNGFIPDKTHKRFGGSTFCREKAIELSSRTWSYTEAKENRLLLAMHEALIASGYGQYDKNYNLTLLLWWLMKNPGANLKARGNEFFRVNLPTKMKPSCQNTPKRYAGITGGGDGGDFYSLWVKFLIFKKASEKKDKIIKNFLLKKVLSTSFEPNYEQMTNAYITYNKKLNYVGVSPLYWAAKLVMPKSVRNQVIDELMTVFLEDVSQ